MKFSLWDFKEWYEKHHIDLSYMISEPTASISMLSTSDAAADGRLGCALVQFGEHSTDCTGFHTVLSYGRDRILFPVASPTEVLDQGAAMIEAYTSWENHLFQQIMSGTALNSLLPSIQEYFPFPLLLLHPNGTTFLRSPDWGLPVSPELTRSIFSGDSQTSQPHFRTIMLDSPQILLTTCVQIQPKCFGALITCNEQNKLRPGDIHLFQEISNFLEMAFHFRSNETLLAHPLSEWLTNALSSQAEKASDPEKLLLQIGWQMKDFYLFAAVQPRDKKTLPTGFAASIHDIDHCCVRMAESLCILIHLNPDAVLDSEVQRLQSYCSDAHCHAGISLPFQGLQSLRPYYQQALWASDFQKSPGISVSSILPHLSHFILNACCSLRNAQALIHPAIRQIAEVDSRDGEQLLKTLYIYFITGQSVTQTANLLFLHRNTVRHRLKKIQSIAPICWNNPADCEQYLLSLLLCPLES